MTISVLVLAGTDVHPFDRLVDWTERFVNRDGWKVTLQFGSARSTTLPGATAFLDRATLTDALAGADVIICHGGPATIAEARAAGVRPIVVPRDPARGEHVDDHQQRFARRLAQSGLVELCETEEAFSETIRATAADPTRSHIDSEAGSVAVSHSALKVGAIADQLVAGRVRVPRQRRPSQAEQSSGTASDTSPANAGNTTAPRQRPAPTSMTVVKPPVRVLFIGGWGRSGSTLAERLIAEMPDVVGAGEITHIWQRALIDNERCSCGATFRACPFWEKVGVEAFGGWDTVNPADVLALKHRVDRTRNVGRLALPTRMNRRRADLARYTDLHRRLYSGIAAVAGADVVIDSSKHISLASTLRHESGIDLRVLHVVRDGRGVAYSWSKEVVRPEAAGTDDLMPQYSAAKSGVLWSTHNALFGVIGAAGARIMRLRYEDLMSDPIGTLADVRRFAGLSENATDYIAPDADGTMVAQLSAAHSIAGNPMRFVNGRVPLRTDSAWRQAMPAPKRRLVSVLTWPGRVRYGYLDRGRTR